jgi:phosphate transport system substrate-binding protein
MHMTKRHTAIALATIAALALAAAGCGGSGGSKTTTTAASASGGGTSKVLVGAGSSLVYPILSQWSADYSKKAGVTVTYGPIGSGGGIEQITNRSVDFGASDAPMTPDQAKASNGVLQIPWALAATLVSYNVKGVPSGLRLSGPVVADMYLGKIKTWDDPAIAKLNPGVKLPATSVKPIYRSDSSGDTYAFTDYLSHVSSSFQSQVGTSTLVQWPGGVGASGNAGVAGIISSTPGAIGYLSAAYTLPNHLKVAAVQNAAGAFATPGLRGIAAAAAAFPTPTDTSNGVEMHIVNPPKSAGKLAYPISTYTYVIVPKSSPKATALRKLVFWALTAGNKKFGPKLVFVPTFPAKVLSAAEKTLKTVQCPTGGCSGV